jgi:ubiquinone/menaquinone biosynthesis C-methylase UbiE
MPRALRRALEAIPGGASLVAAYRRRRQRDHRNYVGGMWDEIGRHQFEWLVQQGLQPSDILCDVACGSLRGGRFFIEYLDPGHYLGIDRNHWLIDAGLQRELPARVREEKRPEFVVSSSFEFARFTKRPTVAIAQSLFSHLTLDDIDLCLRNLRAVMQPGGRFYATFVNRSVAPFVENPTPSDDLDPFAYAPEEILALARASGWHATYIGNWAHPRNQEMLLFTAA